MGSEPEQWSKADKGTFSRNRNHWPTLQEEASTLIRDPKVHRNDKREYRPFTLQDRYAGDTGPAAGASRAVARADPSWNATRPISLPVPVQTRFAILTHGTDQGRVLWSSVETLDAGQPATLSPYFIAGQNVTGSCLLGSPFSVHFGMSLNHGCRRSFSARHICD